MKTVLGQLPDHVSYLLSAAAPKTHRIQKSLQSKGSASERSHVCQIPLSQMRETGIVTYITDFPKEEDQRNVKGNIGMQIN